MRVGIIALQHESNTFLARPTTFDDFRRDILALGSAVVSHYQNAHHEVTGFFDGLLANKIEAVPIFAAMANPSGAITAPTYEILLSMMLEQLGRAGPLDGLLLAPHGAGVSENHRDMDGHWLATVRQTLPEVPIVATIDPHANLSRLMVESTTAIIPYRTNPHLDQRQRGLEAANLLAKTLRHEIRPTMAAAFPPVAINIACQHTESPPCTGLYALANEQLQRPSVLSNGVVLGFPYADVPEMGSSFIAITDNDPVLAQSLADEVANYLITHRKQFDAELPSIDQALDLALSTPPPVCLLDLGDNVGGGSPGDGTLIAQALLQRKIPHAFVCLCDPAAAQAAVTAGIGGILNIPIAGRTHPLHGPPLQIPATVLSLHDGKFSEQEPRHGGRTNYDMGKTAILRAANLTLLVHSVRTPPFSLNQLTSCHLDPGTFRILVAKGVNAPLAAYSPVCKTFIRVNTPGVTTAAMTTLPFHHRRTPLFPFEELP